MSERANRIDTESTLGVYLRTSAADVDRRSVEKPAVLRFEYEVFRAV